MGRVRIRTARPAWWQSSSIACSRTSPQSSTATACRRATTSASTTSPGRTGWRWKRRAAPARSTSVPERKRRSSRSRTGSHGARARSRGSPTDRRSPGSSAGAPWTRRRRNTPWDGRRRSRSMPAWPVRLKRSSRRDEGSGGTGTPTSLTPDAVARYGRPVQRGGISLGKLVLVAMLLAGCGRRQAPPYRTDAITRGPVSEVVNATGDVSAIVTVNVGSQVSGIVNRLYVDFNSVVKRAQLLASLDPRLFQAQLEKAEASLASAKANVQKAQAAYSDSLRIALRQQELLQQGLISQAELETAVATRDQNAAALSAAQASVLQAKADRDMAATNLAFTRIESPIDGIVVSRSVDVGQTVAAAFQAPTLFLIANDLTKMQILANIDEADVGKVHPGLEAKFTVDAYPGETFTGSIRDVRQAPNTIQNVVTYPAVIDAPNPDRKLRQGMTASVNITAARKDDSLRVSNAALRWKPDESTAPEAAPPQRPGGTPQARTASAAARGARDGSGQQAPGRAGRVYKLANGKPVPVNIRVGLSDGQRTEVIEGLSEGDRVIVGGGDAGGSAQQQRRRGPF